MLAQLGTGASTGIDAGTRTGAGPAEVTGTVQIQVGHVLGSGLDLTHLFSRSLEPRSGSPAGLVSSGRQKDRSEAPTLT